MPTLAPNTADFRPSSMQMLWHYARGEYPCYLAEDGGPIGWRKYSHRGIQRMDKIHIASKQKRYVFSDKFEVRINSAFEQVVRLCAAGREGGYTWISDSLIGCYVKLYQMGYAFSAETWSEGQLVGGLFGVHMGSFVTVDSMFHHVDHASKAAYGQLLVRLRDRGFSMIDVNNATEIFSRFGAETLRQWEFEHMMRPLLFHPLSLVDGVAPRALPASIRGGLLAERLVRGAARRARGLFNKPSEKMAIGGAACAQGSSGGASESVAAEISADEDRPQRPPANHAA